MSKYLMGSFGALEDVTPVSMAFISSQHPWYHIILHRHIKTECNTSVHGDVALISGQKFPG